MMNDFFFFIGEADGAKCVNSLDHEHVMLLDHVAFKCVLFSLDHTRPTSDTLYTAGQSANK